MWRIRALFVNLRIASAERRENRSSQCGCIARQSICILIGSSAGDRIVGSTSCSGGAFLSPSATKGEIQGTAPPGTSVPSTELSGLRHKPHERPPVSRPLSLSFCRQRVHKATTCPRRFSSHSSRQWQAACHSALDEGFGEPFGFLGEWPIGHSLVN
jgi:hypothetical protein